MVRSAATPRVSNHEARLDSRSKNMTKHSLGWIGMGRMGYPMAERLVKAGHEVVIWNRTRAKAEPLAKNGGRIVNHPSELASQDIVFTMVSTGKDLEQVCFGGNGLFAKASGPRPKILVDCSSIGIEESEAIRARLTKLGCQLVSSPVSGNGKTVKAGKLSTVVSGPKAAFDQVRPYLAIVAASGVSYVGEGELARICKIAHNVFLGVVIQNLAEITILAQKAGVPRHAFLNFMNASVLGSTFTKYKSNALVNLDLTTTFTPTLLRKDLDLGLEAEIEILAQQRRREGRGEVEIDQRVALVLRERRAEHAGIHEVEKGVTRHAGLLREDGNLGEVLDHDAEEYVVRDLADAGQLALADIGHAGSRDDGEIRPHLVEGGLRTGDDGGKLPGLDGLAVARDRRTDQLAAELGQSRADRLRLLDPDGGAVDENLRARTAGFGEQSVAAETDLLEILAGRYHREHDVLAGQFARVIDDASAILRQWLGLGASPVPDHHLMASLHQPLGHRIAHASHADPAERMFGHVLAPAIQPGLVVRDARRCRAPHHEGLKPHPEEPRSCAASRRMKPR